MLSSNTIINDNLAIYISQPPESPALVKLIFNKAGPRDAVIYITEDYDGGRELTINVGMLLENAYQNVSHT
jgi:hypothetical protein